MHGLAVDHDGTRENVAFLVGIAFVKLRREALGEIVQDVLARRDVDREIAPFFNRDFGEAALHQAFAGRDELHDGGVAALEIGGDRPQQRRRFHRRDEVIEEALLVAFEGAFGGGFRLAVQRAAFAGDVDGLERRFEVGVNDLEGLGIGVIDADLFGRQLVLDDLDLDAFVRERPRDIEAERFQIARQHFHGGDAARLDGGDKIGAVREGKIRAAPKAETLRIGEIVHGRGAGRRDIDDARLRQRMLKPQARAALLRRRLVAALALLAGGVRHGVRLVEQDHAVEIRSQPVEDLLEPRAFAFAFGGAQGRVSGEQNAFGDADRRALAVARLRHDQELLLAERRPVALRVLDQLVGLGDPDGLAASAQPVVENDACGLPALAAAGAVAEEEALAELHGVFVAVFGERRDCRGFRRRCSGLRAIRHGLRRHR